MEKTHKLTVNQQATLTTSGSAGVVYIDDGRTNFWQWDTKQKLIVLDDSITEVRFSNRNMEHSKRRPVYTDNDGLRNL